MTPEGRIKAKVKRALATLGKRYCFMPVQNGMGAPSLDFVNSIYGFFVAIETKTPGKQLTPRQKTTARAVAYGSLGSVFVIRDDTDIAVAMMHMRDPILLNRNRVCGGAIYDTLWDGSAPGEANGHPSVDEAERTPDNDN